MIGAKCKTTLLDCQTTSLSIPRMNRPPPKLQQIGGDMKIDWGTRKLVLTLFQQLKTLRQIRSLTGIAMQILQVWKWKYNHKDFAWAEAEEQERKLSPTEKDELVRLHTQEKNL